MANFGSAVRTRVALRLLVSLVVGGALLPTAQAQNYPARVIRLVAAYTPGSPTDIVARAVADKLGTELGQPVIVENRPGAGGVTGTLVVAGSKPDGYTLLMANAASIIVGPAMTKKPLYDPVSDFAVVGMVGSLSPVLVTGASSPYKTLADLVTYAKKNPGKVTYGAATPTASLLMEMFKREANVDMLDIPYKGVSEASIDLIGGRIDFMLDTPAAAIGNIKNGSVVPLVVFDPDRVSLLPSVPTVGEVGYSALTFVGWNAILAPANTPPEIVRKLEDALRKVVKDEAVKQRLESLSIKPATLNAKEFSELIDNSYKRMSKAALSAGLQQ